MEKEITSRSPKNRYIALVGLAVASKELGSAWTVGAMTIPALEREVNTFLHDLNYNWKEANVRIKENKKTYPEFEWVEIKTYNLKKSETL